MVTTDGGYRWDDDDDFVTKTCTTILHNWEWFTGRQVIVAANLIVYKRPTQAMSKKQRRHLKEAIETIETTETNLEKELDATDPLIHLIRNFAIHDCNGISHSDKKIRAAGAA